MSRRVNRPTDVFKHLNLNPEPPLTCWLWTSAVNDKGLPYFQIRNKKVLAYRVTYWIMHPEWDINNSTEVIRHGCTDLHGNHVDNPLCCNPAHLTPGTHEQNMMDMMLRGRSGLTKEAVRDILSLGMEKGDGIKLTHEEIASLVGKKHGREIGRTTVTDILSSRRRAVMKKLLADEESAIRMSGRDKNAT